VPLPGFFLFMGLRDNLTRSAWIQNENLYELTTLQPTPGYGIIKAYKIMMGGFSMLFLLKLPFKIIAIILWIVLSILSAVMKFLLWLSGCVLALASGLFGIGGIVLLLNGEISSGVGLLVMAFLISPFGIPAIAGWFVGLIDSANDSLKSFIKS